MKSNYHRSRRNYLIGMILILSAMLLAACGGSSSGSSAAQETFPVTLGNTTFHVPTVFSQEYVSSDESGFSVQSADETAEGFLAVFRLGTYREYSSMEKDELLAILPDAIGLTDLSTSGNGPVTFSGQLESSGMKGIYDVLYVDDTEEIFLVAILQRDPAENDYTHFFNGFVESIETNGEISESSTTSGYSSGTTSGSSSGSSGDNEYDSGGTGGGSSSGSSGILVSGTSSIPHFRQSSLTFVSMRALRLATSSSMLMI